MMNGIPRPLSIAFSANGATRTKSDFIALPTAREELIETANKAADAGASIFTFTLRESKGHCGLDKRAGKALIDSLRDATDGKVLFMVELDTVTGASSEQFQNFLEHVRPDACSLRLDQILPQDGDEKEEDAARKLLEACHELGIGVQIALAKPSDVDWFYAYRQYGVIPESCKSLLLILGEDGDVPSSNPHALRPYLANLEKQNLLNKVVWSVSAFGLQETESLTAAIALGGHVAPGFCL